MCSNTSGEQGFVGAGARSVRSGVGEWLCVRGDIGRGYVCLYRLCYFVWVVPRRVRISGLSVVCNRPAKSQVFSGRPGSEPEGWLSGKFDYSLSSCKAGPVSGCTLC